MMPFNREESSLSSKGIKEKDEEGFRTVECLRGRLLAERQASRFAGEQAQLMANKLVELENQLREETKLRAKTEKKLKLLRKKLETLLISPALYEPAHSIVRETGIVSSDSSSTVTVASEAKTTEEGEVESESRFENIDAPTHLELNASGKPLAGDKGGSDAGDFSSEKSGPASCHSCTSMRNLATENKNSYDDDDDDDDQVDDSLALVAVTLPEAEPECKAPSASVGEVLDTLRRARESIQRSMEKRDRMIRVVGTHPPAAQRC